jgi:sterol desaturase/sphingolipid hydroxylase (fatty acid hydroxylase superfamily)
MVNYIEVIKNAYIGYWQYLSHEIMHPSLHNYFYWLVGLSLLCLLLEILFPWRKNQKIIRRDFWLDLFYVFFNYFLFSLIIYNALSDIAVQLFNDFIYNVFGLTNIVAVSVASLPGWLQLVLMFIIRDFIQWNVHRLLHYNKRLWQFHKVHHSVYEMGFAAHLRYHWMENVIYKSIEYIPLAMIGFGLQDFFIVHIIATAIGHLNHSNIKLPLGPLRYIFNNPQMHLWHHAKEIPYPHGVNFGISLSIWDYLFRTNYQPYNNPELKLGFDGDEDYQGNFIEQSIKPFK